MPCVIVEGHALEIHVRGDSVSIMGSVRPADTVCPVPEAVRSARDRLRRAARAAADSMDEFDQLFDEPLADLQSALLAYERSTLAPGDEHTADYDARLWRILARWAEARAALTWPLIRAYLDASPAWSVCATIPEYWSRPEGEGEGRLSARWRPRDGGCGEVSIHGSKCEATDEIARAEKRHAALVLMDILPRTWGLAP